MKFFFLERASTSNFCCATNQNNPYVQVCLIGSIASFTTLWKVLLVGTPHTPRKFLPFSPPHPLGISIDHPLGGYGYSLESHNANTNANEKGNNVKMLNSSARHARYMGAVKHSQTFSKIADKSEKLRPH